MADSNIEWTDKVWNPVRGCTKVSPGCAHCYAETFAERFRGVKGHPYEQGFDLRLVPEKLAEPLSWKKPRRVFVNSMSDLFQDGVPDAFIVEVFAMMAAAHQHTFQVLTKRPERMRNLVCFYQQSGPPPFSQRVLAARNRIPGHRVESLPWPLPNVWLGVSVENQHFADERIPLLLQTLAAMRFVSYEPALGPVDFSPWLYAQAGKGIDWLIVGGESGRGARPFNLQWARDVVNQCRMVGSAPFVKQLGRMPYEGTASPYQSGPEAKNCSLYELDIDKSHGGDPSEWPSDLRVREYPTVRA